MQKSSIDNTMSAWNWITTNWGTTTWKRIPAWVRIALNLRSDLGVYSGMLLTEKSAVGSAEFIAHLNRDRKIKS